MAAAAGTGYGTAEPGPERGGANTSVRVRVGPPSDACSRERCFSGNGVEGEACVCHPRKHKEQYSPVDPPEHASCRMFNKPWEKEGTQSASRRPDLRCGPGPQLAVLGRRQPPLSDAYHPVAAHLWLQVASKQLPGQRRP